VVDTIYCSGDPERAAQLTRTLGATYLLDTGPPRACQPTIFDGSQDWELVYDRSGVRIWQVSGGVASIRAPGSVSFRR
jgi:hypothetical protein